jgi:hypothetical protein
MILDFGCLIFDYKFLVYSFLQSKIKHPKLKIKKTIA